MPNTKKKLIIGISGATGVIYGVRLLEILKSMSEIETHLIISPSAEKTLELESDYTLDYIQSLACVCHEPNDMAAAISSGSFKTMGMIVVPCSIKSLSGIAHSYNENLLIRAADVCLKEKRKVILCVRETPFHQGHLELMLKANQIGATIMPLLPAFYHKPQSIEMLIDQSLARVLDQFELSTDLFTRWGA